MAKLASTTYGDALFELALEENKLDAFLNEAKDMRDILSANEDLLKLLNHPKIVREEKIQIIENIFKGNCSDEMMGFLDIVVRKGRYNELLPMLEHFIARAKKEKGIGVVYVTSAVLLTAIHKQAITEKLLSLTSYKKFEFHYEVRPEIIGGLIIRVDDRVVDSSIKTRLANMNRSLSKIQL